LAPQPLISTRQYGPYAARKHNESLVPPKSRRSVATRFVFEAIVGILEVFIHVCMYVPCSLWPVN